MIVKNESKIIVRLLESIVDFIDGYCICDTGSTDDTIEKINTYLMIRMLKVMFSNTNLKILVIIETGL